jgi:hypothetical protein
LAGNLEKAAKNKSTPTLGLASARAKHSVNLTLTTQSPRENSATAAGGMDAAQPILH